MKILIPTNDDKGLESTLSKHFGKARYYTLVDDENDPKEVKSFANVQEGHSCSNSAQKILALSPDVLIVGGIGANPARIFKEQGLKVMIDGSSKTISEVLDAYKNGKLVSIEGKGTCSSH